MPTSRRGFLSGIGVLLGWNAPSNPLPQLMLHLGFHDRPAVRPDRLVISFDLWRCLVDGVGGEANLRLKDNRVPADAANRIADWLLKQDALDPLDRQIPMVLQFQQPCGLIPLHRMSEFFGQGECQIVLLAGHQSEL